MIRAFARLNDPERRARDRGRGRLSARRSRRWRTRLTSAIASSFLGDIARRRSSRLLRRAWALVFASPKEGWGITNLEAAACATPVVASNSPGIRESVRDGETGFLVPHGDIAAMAAAMRRVAGSRDLVERLGAEARAFAETLHVGARRRRDRGAPSARDRGRESRVTQAAHRRTPARTSQGHAPARARRGRRDGLDANDRESERVESRPRARRVRRPGFPRSACRCSARPRSRTCSRSTPTSRRANLEQFFSFPIPCVFITKGQEPGPDLVDLAASAGVAIIRVARSRPTSSTSGSSPGSRTSSHRRPTCTDRSPTCSASACCSSGKSGIGKSECVLDLVERGHRLVADDLVIARRRGRDVLIGRGHELQRHYMEIRGVGLIDIPSIFGIRAVRQQKRIEVVVQLEEWDHGDAAVDRTGLDGETTTILDVELPKITRSAQPGKEHHRRRRGDRDEPPAQVQRHRSRRAVQRASRSRQLRGRSDVQRYLQEDDE